MSLRFLLGILAPGPPDQNLQSLENETNSSENIIHIYEELNNPSGIINYEFFQPPAKLHIAMHSLSLIIGLGFGGFISYTCWMEQRPILSYIRNLVIALVCKTFFSLVFDGVVLLGSPFNVGGGNTLLAFEMICITLVFAFWLTLTTYIHARVQRNFNSEPTLNLYKYGVPGVAVFFAFVWIFLLQNIQPNFVWWYSFHPIFQWTVNSFNLLCLLIQLALVGDIVRMMMKTSLDNDSVSLLWKATILMGVLVFIFWLQLGLYIGLVPMVNSSSYIHFFFFIDGTECGLVCVILYFFQNWVLALLDTSSITINEEIPTNLPESANVEMLAGNGGRRIVTIDSVFMTDESGKWKNSEEEGPRDVVYSNVVEPQRLKGVLDLYKRLKIIPSKQVTEEFDEFGFQTENSPKKTQRSISEEPRKRVSDEESFKTKSLTVPNQTQKKSTFYSSKYLIFDSKDAQKCLDKRSSLSTLSGRESPLEERRNKDHASDAGSLKKEDRVRKWLSENSDNLQEDTPMQTTKDTSDEKISKRHSIPKEASDTSQLTEKRESVTQKFVSKFNSVWGGFFGNDSEKKTEDEVPVQTESNLQPEVPIQTGEGALNLKESIDGLMKKMLGLTSKDDDTNEPGKTGDELNFKPELKLHDKNYTKEEEVVPEHQVQADHKESTDPIKHAEPESHLKQFNDGLTETMFEVRNRDNETEKFIDIKDEMSMKPEAKTPEKNESSVEEVKEQKVLPEEVAEPKDEQRLTPSELTSHKIVPPDPIVRQSKTEKEKAHTTRDKERLRNDEKEVKNKTDNFTPLNSTLQPFKTVEPHPPFLEEDKKEYPNITTSTDGKRLPIPSKAVGVDNKECYNEESSSESEFGIEKVGKEEKCVEKSVGVQPQVWIPREAHVLPKYSGYKSLNFNVEEETSSASEFSIENRRISSSSSGSFTIEQYYQDVLSAKNKLQNPPDNGGHTVSYQDKHIKNRVSLPQTISKFESISACPAKDATTEETTDGREQDLRPIVPTDPIKSEVTSPREGTTILTDTQNQNEAKKTHLNQYLTYSELEEYRRSRENQPAEVNKNVFSIPNTISSIMGKFISGSTSLLSSKATPDSGGEK